MCAGDFLHTFACPIEVVNDVHVSTVMESSVSGIHHAPRGKTTNHLPFVAHTGVDLMSGTSGPV